ncbi:MAG: hypothetical protein ACI9ES_001663 [Oceanospirillaceae bacterium]|jgi:hypothetical protein
MKKIIRFLVLLAVIVVSFYLMMTVFVVFACLAAFGGLVWLYLRYFGKSGNVTNSTKGVTIDQASQFVNTSASSSQKSSSQGSESDKDFDDIQQNEVYSEAEVISADYDVYALYDLYEAEVRAYCLLPSPSLPTIVPDIIELTNHVEANDQLRAKTFRLLGELYEANNELGPSLEYYQKALSLDAKVGVKRKITKLDKMINL